MRITILNLADKFVLKFKRLFYAQVSEVVVRRSGKDKYKYKLAQDPRNLGHLHKFILSRWCTWQIIVTVTDLFLSLIRISIRCFLILCTTCDEDDNATTSAATSPLTSTRRHSPLRVTSAATTTVSTMTATTTGNPLSHPLHSPTNSRLKLPGWHGV